MKKLLSVALCLVLIFCAMPVFAISASAEETEGYYTYTISNGEATITDCDTSISGDVVIPSELDGCPVTAIGESAFKSCDNITSITIPNSVTSIGSYAFSNCISLKNLIIPDSVTNIGVGAFIFCSDLINVTIGKNVTSIGSNAFSSCDNLGGVYISDLAKWCKISFGNASSNPLNNAKCLYLNGNVVRDLVIPDNITRIASFSFYNCVTINSVTMGENVTQIGFSAFEFCANLTSVTISNSVTSIGSYAFSNTNLTSVIIPKSITSISAYAFSSCQNLRNITIPKSVKRIENNAFGWCYNLTEVYYAGESQTGIVIYSSNLELYNADLYYNACIGTLIHVYDDSCDTECNVCVELRVAPHYFDNACDTVCNVCDYTRIAPHDYEWIIDKQETCGVNGEKHKKCIGCYITCDENTVIEANGNHSFANVCDTECSVCDYIRTAPHDFEWVVDSAENCAVDGIKHEECTVCHTTRNENTVVSATGNHIYDNGCDAACNICGNERTPDIHRIEASHFSLENSTSYPFALSNGIYSSTNKSHSSSSTFTITALCDCVINIEYYTSTESTYDKMTIKHNSTTEVVRSGSTSWATLTLNLVSGDKVYINYSKDASVSSGSDTVCFKISKNMVPADTIEPTCEEAVVCDICGTVVKNALGHSYDNACDTDCNKCGLIRSVPDHIYYNACDTDCNVCGDIRTITHIYDNTCDIDCNVCGYIRTITHSYDWVIDKQETCGVDGEKHEECTVCYVKRSENTVINATGQHIYDNTCDTDCNVCKQVRTIEHTYANECDRDCNICGEFRKAPHKYDNDCDDTCDLCSAEREIGDHQYTNACDASCNSCGFERTPSAHIYDNACDKICNVCEETRTVSDHIYDNACDAFCNVCQAERIVSDHKYSSVCDTACNVCQKRRANTVAHTYTNNCDVDCNFCGEIRIPDEHIFTNSCDSDCNICGHIRAIEHKFTNECDNECNICFETRKPPHLYDNDCDVDCNICKKTRVPFEHRYNNSCDIDCNECGDIRAIEHTYSGDDDLVCNVCYESLIPSVPVVESCDAQSITLVVVEGCEYSIDGANWQSSNVFKNLKSETEYTFYQRVKESKTSKQSGSSEPLKTKTPKGYTITFCYNDGSDSSFTKIKTQGVTLSLGSVSKSGYTFLGWSHTPNGTTFISSYAEDKNATFYAKWAYKCLACSGKGYTTEQKYTTTDCSTCYGRGTVTTIDNTNLRCLDCGSKNLKTEFIPTSFGGYGERKYCGSCYSENIGKGYKETKNCTNCGADGIISEYVPTRVSCDNCDGKGKTTAPQPKALTPVIKIQGDDFIELEAVVGAEYSCNGITWQLSPIFNSLPSGVYFVYQRYAATSINTTGEASEPLIIKLHKHSYDNACDTDCNECGDVRTVGAHTYDDIFDPDCNVCGDVREIVLSDGWVLDGENWFYIIAGERATGWQFLGDVWYYFNDAGIMQTGWVTAGGNKYLFDASGHWIEGAHTFVIDLSRWQGNVKWDKLAQTDVDGVILRISYGGTTDDFNAHKDAKFEEYLENVKEKQMSYGVYHFNTATTVEMAQLQANNVVSLLKQSGANPDLPVFVDIETNGGECDLNEIAKVYISTFIANGYKPGIYSNEYYWKNYLNSSEFNAYYKWISSYGSNDGYPKASFSPEGGIENYVMWQYTSAGEISGVDENTVDFNALFSWYEKPDGWTEISGKRYHYSNGCLTYGWLLENNNWYYLNSMGEAVTGWLLLGDTWYYLKENGVMQTGWLLLGNTWYYLADGGNMVTGWQLIGGTWYYFHEGGNMATGWLLLGNTWYYLAPGGNMVTGWQNIGGTWYYFHAGGNMATGWLLIGNTWYYLADGGAMLTGWQYIGGTWYYFNQGGAWVA